MNVNELAADPLSLVAHLAMAVSLAACAGMRAFLPLLAIGVAGRLGGVPLAEEFAFLTTTPALVAFGGATLFEMSADKIVAVDHALDALSTFIRPLAGTVLAAASLSELDPLLAVVAGIVIGGGTSLTVHAGKSAVRAKSTSLAPIHGGLGNAALSVGEDLAAVFGVLLSIFAPLLALAFALAAIVISFFAIRALLRAGRKLREVLRGEEPPAPNDA